MEGSKRKGINVGSLYSSITVTSPPEYLAHIRYSAVAWAWANRVPPLKFDSVLFTRCMTLVKSLNLSVLSPHLRSRNNNYQFSSFAQSCLTLCNPMDCSMPHFPVHHQLLKLAQTHVHQVSDAIQPSHPQPPFSSCLQSFPTSGSCPMSQFIVSGGQSIRMSASASVLPMNI